MAAPKIYSGMNNLVMLDAAALRHVLTPAACLAALTDAYRRLHDGAAAQPQDLTDRHLCAAEYGSDLDADVEQCLDVGRWWPRVVVRHQAIL